MPVSRSEILAELDPPFVKGLQVLQVALATGVLLFAGVVAYFAGSLAEGSEASTETAELVRLLSFVNAALFAGAWIASEILFRRQLGHLGEDPSGDVANSLQTLRSAWTQRLAIREAPALLGVAVCFLARGGLLQSQPALWWNLLPAGLFVLFAFATMPTRERLADAASAR